MRAPMMPAGTAHRARAEASSALPIRRSTRRLPVSHTAAMTPSAIISPYARSCSGPMWMAPESGLGMKASAAGVTGATLVGPGRHLLGKGHRLLADELGVVVQRGHVVAALEGDPLDRAGHCIGQVVGAGRLDHVVVGRRHDEHRAV